MGFFRKLSSYLGIGDISKFKFFLPILLGLSPTLALAANLFDPSGSDISLRMLGTIFGGLMDGTGGGSGADPMLSAIKMFNGGVLIIGGILAAYTILAGTLGTAHDGEMLGKKFSSVWIPVRYSVGTALVLPVVGGGYCVMQAIVMWLVIQGVGLADQVWTSYMSTAANGNAVADGASRRAIEAVAFSAFKSSVCYQAYAKTIADNSANNVLLKWDTIYKYEKRKTASGYGYGDTYAIMKSNGCGTVTYPKAPQNLNQTVNSTPSTGGGQLGDISNLFAPLDVSSINAAHVTQTDTLVSTMDTIAAESLSKSGTMTMADAQAEYAKIEAAVDQYITAINNAASTALSGQDGFSAIKQASQNQGWIMAGAWFTRLVKMNDVLHSSVNSTPTAEYSTPSGIDDSLFKDAVKYLAVQDMVLNNATDSSGVNSQIDSNRTQTTGNNTPNGGSVDASTTLGKITASITSALTTIDLYSLKNDTRHPLIIMAAIGNRLENLSIAILGATTIGGVGLAVAAAVWPGGAGVIQVALTIVGWFISLPIQMLVGGAMAMKYFLPNLPYIIWIGAIVGWVLLVIEAIIAAPLWAVMHLHPNGDDLTGRGGNGYMLVLSLLLRPVLMIFGLIASIVISSVIGEFINKTFFEVFSNNTDITGISGLLGIVAGTILYFVVMLTFIRKCFGIIHQLPDQLLKWIGGGDNALGQFAGEFAGAADKAQGTGAAVGGFAVGSLGKMGTGAGMKTLEGSRRADDALGKGVGSQDATFRKNGIAGALMRARGSNEDASGNKFDDGLLRNDRGAASYTAQKQEQRQAANDKALDGEAGGGSAAIRDNFTNMLAESGAFGGFDSGNTVSDFKSAFGNSMIGAKLTGGENAKNEFTARFAESQASGFKGYANATDAATKIGHEVQTSAISDRLSGKSYKEQAMSFSKSAAGDGENITNGRTANMIVGSLNKIESSLGADAVVPILEKASEQSTPKEQLSSFVKAYKNI